MQVSRPMSGLTRGLSRCPESWPPPAKLLFFLIAYLGQHTPVGFTWLALPVIFRGCGIELATIGLLALLYAPWALKFLYAPFVDRFFLPDLGHRKSWILPTRILVPAILSVLAFFPPDRGTVPVFALVLAMNTALALGDIALDGYAADILLPRERALGSAVQMGANFTGFMIGGGIFLILFHHLGWATTLILLAGFLSFLSLPLFIFKERVPLTERSVFSAINCGTPVNTLSFIRSPQTLGFFILLGVMALVLKTGYQLRFTLLGDMGLSPARIGILVLWAGSPVAIFGTWLGSVLIQRVAARHFFSLGCLATALVAGASWVMASGGCRAGWFMALAVGGEQLLMGILMSSIYALILQASAGHPGAATRFGILCGFQHFSTFAAVILGGWMGQTLGYTAVFQILTLASLAFVFPVHQLFQSLLRPLDRAFLSFDPQFTHNTERKSHDC